MAITEFNQSIHWARAPLSCSHVQWRKCGGKVVYWRKLCTRLGKPTHGFHAEISPAVESYYCNSECSQDNFPKVLHRHVLIICTMFTFSKLCQREIDFQARFRSVPTILWYSFFWKSERFFMVRLAKRNSSSLSMNQRQKLNLNFKPFPSIRYLS